MNLEFISNNHWKEKAEDLKKVAESVVVKVGTLLVDRFLALSPNDELPNRSNGFRVVRSGEDGEHTNLYGK